jgi:hypothetical protein
MFFQQKKQTSQGRENLSATADKLFLTNPVVFFIAKNCFGGNVFIGEKYVQAKSFDTYRGFGKQNGDR